MPEVLTSDGLMAAADEPDFTMFENKTGLAEDLKFLASIPELCDVTFLVNIIIFFSVFHDKNLHFLYNKVGETREPVCAVKVCHNRYHKMLYIFTHHIKKR